MTVDLARHLPAAPAEAAPPTSDFYMKLGGAVIAIAFGGIALWSLIAPISSAIVAAGQVVVESNRKTVQHLEGGTISEILVREGDLVDEGAVVARIDATVPRANLALIDSQLRELYARRARAEAERDGASEIAAPRGEEAVLSDPRFREKMEGQTRLFLARRRTRVSQVSLLNERVQQQAERIRGLTEQINASGKEQILILEELQGLQELYDKGYYPRNRVIERQREQERLSGREGQLRASVAEAESIISEARIEIERLNEVVREEAITELRDVEVSIAELEERRITAADALRRTEITAPQRGRVLGLQVFTEGGVVAPGAPIMDIVPENDRLLVAARVAPQDIDKVEEGQETLIRFSAFGSRQTPETTGMVKTVSADSVVDENTGVPYYQVIVEFEDEAELDRVLRGKQLVPGMPVEGFIQTGKKPAISYLLKPLTDSFARSMKEE